MTDIIYKIVPDTLWRQAKEKGVFEGAEIDLRDGYIHFPPPRRPAKPQGCILPGRRG